MPKPPDKRIFNEKLDFDVLRPNARGPQMLTVEALKGRLQSGDAPSYAEAFPTGQPVSFKQTHTLNPLKALLVSTHRHDVARLQEMLRRGMSVSEIAESLKLSI